MESKYHRGVVKEHGAVYSLSDRGYKGHLEIRENSGANQPVSQPLTAAREFVFKHLRKKSNTNCSEYTLKDVKRDH